MSQVVETYEARAKRLGMDPTETCIACGSDAVRKTLVAGDKFCERHVDWEQRAVVLCGSCRHRVGLTCSVGVAA